MILNQMSEEFWKERLYFWKDNVIKKNKTGLKRIESKDDAFNLGRRDKLNGIEYNNIFSDLERKESYIKGFNSIKEN
jgi:hypothetical protein